MIFVKAGINGYRYEIEDVLKLFFRDNEIVFCNDGLPVKSQGAFLLLEYFNNGSQLKATVEYEGSVLTGVLPVGLIHEEEKNYEKRKTFKRELKRQIYTLLSQAAGKELPWGILTGIRPGKIVHEMMEQRSGKEEILERLQNYYKVSPSKSKLLYRTAEVEKEILKNSGFNTVSIYISIPFCTTRCLYCSFTSNPVDRYSNLITDYIQALKGEIYGVNDIIESKGYTVQTVYIGGGTPTSINAISLNELLETVEEGFELKGVEEYTLEAGRPDSIDADKLGIAKESRVTRISINPQTMNNETLKLIGRGHTAEDVVEKFGLARKMGFDNINMDIIVGLPRENADMFENTLKKIKKLNPDSLTVHTMAVKKGSRLKESVEEFSLITSKQAEEMVNTAYRYAESMGMHPYYLYRQKNMLGDLENIGYCRPGLEGIYNVQIMEEKQTILALGAGAVTKVVYPDENKIERGFNVKNVNEYINRVDEMVERKKKLLFT